jgi:bifunctional non-homologous end joining protein LigD
MVVASRTRPRLRPASGGALIPAGQRNVTLRFRDREVKLTNLHKVFWPGLGITKGDLLRYYAEISPWLLPHLDRRAMVMKRYPGGAGGPFFFQKRVPGPHPDWLGLCTIEHASGNIIDFPVVQDLASLLWIVNLGCIDLNPWYARCDAVHQPDFLHFDLDPVEGTPFKKVREVALLVRDGLAGLGMTSLAKTTGSRGIHVYVAIRRGPEQKQVWDFARQFALGLGKLRPEVITTEYRVAKRPPGRVLVDFNQNAWGRTLASVYSVRPKPLATVSTPVSWEEIEQGIEVEDFRIDNVPERVRKAGDLWAPLLEARDRFRLEPLLETSVERSPAYGKRARVTR